MHRRSGNLLQVPQNEVSSLTPYRLSKDTICRPEKYRIILHNKLNKSKRYFTKGERRETLEMPQMR
jgi:hypothetical protein